MFNFPKRSPKSKALTFQYNFSRISHIFSLNIAQIPRAARLQIRDDKELQGTKKVTASPMVSGSASSPTMAGGQDWVWFNADTRIQVSSL